MLKIKQLKKIKKLFLPASLIHFDRFSILDTELQESKIIQYYLKKKYKFNSIIIELDMFYYESKDYSKKMKKKLDLCFIKDNL